MDEIDEDDEEVAEMLSGGDEVAPQQPDEKAS
jgi:hypothetical protein